MRVRRRWGRILATLAMGAGIFPASAAASSPSFPCDGIRPGSIEALICTDDALAALDRKLADVYAAALAEAANEHPPVLRAEQRGWIKGRDDCWKSDDRRACVVSEYRNRIAGLQARYRLVPMRGPYRFGCNGDPANEVTVAYFETDPPTLVAERSDQVSLMFGALAAGTTEYTGRNETFRERNGAAAITWGYGTREMRCTLKN